MDDLASSNQSESNLPPPLVGCLYCHAEGTMIQSEGRKIFGIGSDLPILTCNHCGAVATFDPGDSSDNWRIRYRKYSRDKLYYYAALHLGKAGWLAADDALQISKTAYVQRFRVQQVQQGDLSWLKPSRLNLPPPLMNPEELIYLTFRHVLYRQSRATFRPNHSESDLALDSGTFYLTDRKIHLLGQQRDWSYRLSDIYSLDFNNKAWFIYLKNDDSFEYFQGNSHPDEIDAQLATVIVEALRQKK